MASIEPSGKAPHVRHTRTSRMRQDLHSPRYKQDLDFKTKAIAHRVFAQKRSRSMSRKRPPPAPPPTPVTLVQPFRILLVTKTPSDSDLSSSSTPFRSLLNKRASQNLRQPEEMYKIIKSEAVKYKEQLIYRFFHKLFPRDPREQLEADDVKELLLPNYSHDELYEFYAQELSKCLITDPAQIGLNRHSSIEDLEAGAQAANNFYLLVCAIERQFRAVFDGPLEKVPYFFECLKTPFWKAVRELDLSFQPVDPEDSIGFTRLPEILSTAPLPLLRKVSLANHRHLVKLPKGLFPKSSRLHSFDLSYTSLKSFPKDFATAWHLEELYCQGTRIQRLSALLQKNTRHLRILDASNNLFLAIIEGNPAEAWPSMEKFNLMNTSIPSSEPPERPPSPLPSKQLELFQSTQDELIGLEESKEFRV